MSDDAASADVFALPPRVRTTFEGRFEDCRRFARSHAAPDVRRLVMVSASPSDDGPGAAVCVSAPGRGRPGERAAEVVAAWERHWLLIASMPARHREEVGADLRNAIAEALVAAAPDGVGDQGGPDEDIVL